MSKDKKWDFPVRKTRKKEGKANKKLLEEARAKVKALEALVGEEDVSDIVGRAIEISQILEDVKELYKEQDEIIEQLLETGETQFEHEDGILTLVDMFTEKNKQWKSVPFSRFVIEVTGKG
jgi:5-bromo-4-chloroindolyl phosphate hydrolysis protein